MTGEDLAQSRSILPPRGHMLLARRATGRANRQRSGQAEVACRLRFPSIGVQRVNPNLLYVDYCDVEAYGRKLRGTSTQRARTRPTGSGRASTATRGASSSSEQSIDPNQIRNPSCWSPTGSRAEALLGNDEVSVCIERPGSVPDHAQRTRNRSSGSGSRWFDEDMARFPVGDHLCEGENTLVLEARPFTTLCEIMPVYVRGDFTPSRPAKGFTFAAVPGTPWRLDAQGAPLLP